MFMKYSHSGRTNCSSTSVYWTDCHNSLLFSNWVILERWVQNAVTGLSGINPVLQ